jgi:hypothetical protein
MFVAIILHYLWHFIVICTWTRCIHVIIHFPLQFKIPFLRLTPFLILQRYYLLFTTCRIVVSWSRCICFSFHNDISTCKWCEMLGLNLLYLFSSVISRSRGLIRIVSIARYFRLKYIRRFCRLWMLYNLFLCL